MAKNCYHSNLAKLSPVTVTVTSDVMPSKFKKEGSPNKWVVLKINGEEFSHSLENEACATALTGLKGQTVTLRASGSREDASIAIFDSVRDGANMNEQPAPAHAPASVTATAQPARASHAPVYGATVGNCLKLAVDTVLAIGTDPFSPEYYRQVHQISSDLIRVALLLEAGTLAPTSKSQA